MKENLDQANLFHSIMDILIDVEKGNINHIDGTEKVFSAVKAYENTEIKILNFCSIEEARDFFETNKLAKISVALHFNNSEETILGWDGAVKLTILDLIDQEVGYALAVYFEESNSIEVTDSKFAFSIDSKGQTLLISSKEHDEFDIWVSVVQ